MSSAVPINTTMINRTGPIVGAAGPYDRARLARLYGGTRVRVVRGWAETAGHFESVTLLSPYPDPDLTRLQPGTMVISWTFGG